MKQSRDNEGLQYMKTVKTKNRLKQATSAILTCVILAQTVPMAHSTGIPVFDGAQEAYSIWEQTVAWGERLKRWAETATNWEKNLANWIREKMQKIDGVKELMDKNQENKIREMFQERRQRCNRLRNSTSRSLCTQTVNAEEKKYDILIKLDSEVSKDFAKINGKIDRQKTGDKDGGKAASTEQEVQKDIQALSVKLEQYKNEIESLDRLIEQLKWARKQLTKDQLTGTNFANTAAKATAFEALRENAASYRTKANGLKLKSAAQGIPQNTNTSISK